MFNNPPPASSLPPPPEPASGEEELDVPVSKIPPTNYKFRIMGRSEVTLGEITIYPDTHSFHTKYTIVPPAVNIRDSRYIKDIEPGIGFPELANEVGGTETKHTQYTHMAKLAAPIDVNYYVSNERRFPKKFVFPADTPVGINYSSNTKGAKYYTEMEHGFTISIDIRYLRSRLGGGSRRKSKHCRRTRKRKC